MRGILIATWACALTASMAAAQDADEGKVREGLGLARDAIAGQKPADGFYAEFGGIPTGAGISAGPGYRHELFDGRARIDVSGAVAWSHSTFAQGTFELPHLANDHLSVGFQVKRQDFTRVSYFGIGDTSSESNVTDYRVNNTDYLGFAAVRPRKWLTFGSRFGVTPNISIEAPKQSDNPAVADIFTDAMAPGLSQQPRFLHGDGYVDVDTRNHRTRPTNCGDYRFTYSQYSDRDYDLFSFRLFEGEAMQFIPTFGERGVIALRARVTGTDTASDQSVPFYMLPTLGSSRSLRGYDDYRFRDNDALLMNVEYRWRLLDRLDTAVFYDAGKVAPTFGDLGLTDLKKSYGAGLRLGSSESTFFRLDVARSDEGTRLLVSVGDVLRPGHGSIGIPFMP